MGLEMKKSFVILLILIPLYSNAKLLIMTYSYNRPDFIEFQYKTFKKFLNDEYEFVVFNDAPGDEMCHSIKEMCEKYAITCHRIPQEIHTYDFLERWPEEPKNSPSIRNANVVQYSLQLIGYKHDDIVVLLDSDMFLVKPFSIKNYLAHYGIAGVDQLRGTHINYIWIGIVFLNMPNLPDRETINFNCGKIDDVGVDVGGHTHYYLKNHPNVPVKYIGYCSVHEAIDNPLWSDFVQKDPGGDFFLEKAFLHYGSGTNWNNKTADYHTYKTAAYNALFLKLLS
jgi:hypothetical protein